MSWQDISEVLVRHAINDVDDPQRYNSDRLQLAFLVGFNYVNQEVNLKVKYNVDLIGINLYPDPTEVSATLGEPDQWAVNLSVAKTAIFMLSNDLKLAVNSAWSIKDVGMSIDMKELYKANKLILDEIKDIYERAKMDYMVGVAPAAAAILTPINILAGGYRAPLYGYDTRDRMLW